MYKLLALLLSVILMLLSCNTLADEPVFGFRKGMMLSTLYELCKHDIQIAEKPIYITHTPPEEAKLFDEFYLCVTDAKGLVAIIAKSKRMSVDQYKEIVETYKSVFKEPLLTRFSIEEKAVVVRQIWSSDYGDSAVHDLYSVHLLELVSVWEPDGKNCVVVLNISFTEEMQTPYRKFKVDKESS